MICRVLTIGALVFLFSSLAQAQSFTFDELTESQANNIINELSGNFLFSSVSGASSLGDIFGIEFGVVGGATRTKDIDSRVKSVDSSADADPIYHGGILLRASVPLGFTGEILALPAVGTDDFKYKSFGMALKWTITSLFTDLPFSLALRAHYNKSNVNFKQTVSSVSSSVDYKSAVSGLDFMASMDLIIVEPYVGIGFASGDGSFGVSGTTDFFESGVTTYSNKDSTLHLVAGAELKLVFFKLGAEYSRAFDTNTFNGKVAFYF